MAFHDVRLPVCIERGAQGGPRFKTSIFELGSGFESVSSDWVQTRGEWDISYGVRNKSVLNDVIEFFYARYGQAHTFRFKDWSDYNIGEDSTDTPSQIGVGDGSTTEFAIIKTYDSGSEDYDRPITRPVIDTIRVFVSGVEQTLVTDYSIDSGSNEIVFLTAPLAGFVIAVISEFDVPVRFDMGELEISSFRDDLIGMPAIRVVEVQESLSDANKRYGLWNKARTSKDVSAQEGDPSGLFFHPGGENLIMCGRGDEEFNQYVLSTAWDITSASASKVQNISAYGNLARDMHVSPDGTKIYNVFSGVDKVVQYSMSTPWDIDTLAWVREFTGTGDTNTTALSFDPTGSIMYLGNNGTSDGIRQFTLTTPWNISTATATAFYDTSSFFTFLWATVISPDGFTLLATGDFTDTAAGKGVIQFDMTTAWDITTASNSGMRYPIYAVQEAFPAALATGDGGTKLYYAGNSMDTIYQVNL